MPWVSNAIAIHGEGRPAVKQARRSSTSGRDRDEPDGVSPFGTVLPSTVTLRRPLNYGAHPFTVHDVHDEVLEVHQRCVRADLEVAGPVEGDLVISRVQSEVAVDETPRAASR